MLTVRAGIHKTKPQHHKHQNLQDNQSSRTLRPLSDPAQAALTCVCLLQGYYFNTNNPYREWPSAFAEGQEKAREGDLNAAVLLLEAAILQDPQDSEVT